MGDALLQRGHLHLQVTHFGAGSLALGDGVAEVVFVIAGQSGDDLLQLLTPDGVEMLVGGAFLIDATAQLFVLLPHPLDLLQRHRRGALRVFVFLLVLFAQQRLALHRRGHLRLTRLIGLVDGGEGVGELGPHRGELAVRLRRRRRWNGDRREHFGAT